MNRGVFMTPGSRRGVDALGAARRRRRRSLHRRVRGARGRPDLVSGRDLAELAAVARRFVDEHCIPHEETAERNGGRLPAETAGAIGRAAQEAGLVGIDHSPEHGGQGMGLLEQVDRARGLRAQHERRLVAHPERRQRALPRHARSDRPLPPPRAARRARRVLRDHRGRGRLRSRRRSSARRGAAATAG